MKTVSLSKSFGDKKVLSALSLEAHGLVGISGPSGAGKTTLLRIIAGLEKADTGCVSDAGKVSFCFQEPRLLPWKTALENAAIAECKEGLAREILSALGLEKDLSAYPSDLSGGMQRRVSLARALCAEYDTLLLDEPFTGLDRKTAHIAMDAVKKYSKDKCVLLVTHDRDLLQLTDKIIEIL